MITGQTHDGTIEILVYETDRIIIAFNRNGTCVTRITVMRDALAGPFSDIVITGPASSSKEPGTARSHHSLDRE